MLDSRERKRQLRIALLAGMTGFVLVSLLMLIVTPSPRDPVESHIRWVNIARIAIPAGLFTMSLTWFLVRRQG
jgi:hypothetical protein